MLQNTKNFFNRKKEWSKVKDELLQCYLKPYFAKIIQTRKTINYIDCFAGKGKFDDGEIGSPLIALNAIKEAKENSSIANTIINSYFIEPKFYNDLKNNLSNFSNVEVIDGNYADRISDILKNKKNENIFLYIDPFGIKCLPFNLYSLYNKQNFNSIEFLLNFNSFGFIRLACKVKKAEINLIKQIESILRDGIIDEDFISDENSFNAIDDEEEIDKIAGGNYWQFIINDLIDGKINCYETEKKIVFEYCKKLNEHFKYVINMPIRLKAGQLPKYRMIYGTNNEDGCLLMVQNICKRWELLGDIQSRNAGNSLFNENIENEIIDENIVQEKLVAYLRGFNSPVSMSEFLANMFNDLGVFTDWKTLKNCLKTLEEKRIIELKRTPSITPTGKVSAFIFDSKKDNHFVKIQLCRQ